MKIFLRLLFLIKFVVSFQITRTPIKNRRFFNMLAPISSNLASLFISSSLTLSALSPFGNIKLAIDTVINNPESITCTIDNQNVKEDQSSCQQIDRIVRVRAGKLLTINQDWGGSVSTGASVWNGENVAIQYMENKLGQKYFSDKSVIELGSGVGFSSLVANLLGAKEVVITDGNEDVLKLASENILNNINKDSSKIIRTERLRWNTEDENNFIKTKWDCILASDVTYKKTSWNDLMHTIASLSNKNSIAILSMEPRNVGEVEGVIAEAKKYGLSVKEEQLILDKNTVCNLLCPRLFVLTLKE